ncbi:MAG: hypothetical protein EPO40_28295 [Myxococcaceae bacterium]|nr:MAG: hypothetical protein EPO40_28295 [Myxococcaceae bacterium]
MNQTLRRWISASRPRLGARLALLTFAALGHWLFLRSLWWTPGSGAWLPLVLAAPNLIVLSTVLLAPSKVAWLRRGPTLPLVVATSLLFGSLSLPVALARSTPLGNALWSVVGMFLGGALCGLLGAMVATPLSLAVERWRAEPSPRRALDAWATLSCCAAAFAVTRPTGLDRSTRLCMNSPAGSASCADLGFVRALHHLDIAFAVAAMALAAAVLLLDLRLRRIIARAHSGEPGDHRVIALDGADVSGAVSFATSSHEAMVALVGSTGGAGYRDDASASAVALIPKQPEVSWRLVAMPMVVALCALGLALLR